MWPMIRPLKDQDREVEPRRRTMTTARMRGKFKIQCLQICGPRNVESPGAVARVRQAAGRSQRL